MDNKKHIIQDSTTDYGGGRIPHSTDFKTIWSKEIKLLQYFTKNRYQSELTIQSLEKLTRQDKLAISRHKKMLKIKLGLIKKPEEVKIIHQSNHPTAFYTDWVVEKEKTFQSNQFRYDKRDCVLWTKEKAELVKQYNKLRNEMSERLEKIEKEIMEE